RRELSRFHRGVLHLHSTYAGLVGRLVPAPGWARFYTPQGYAFLNGSHPRGLRWLTLVAETALAPRAHTIACSRAEGAAAAALARTDVLVHFSAFEGLPLSLLEAMRAGRAVVASDLPAIREVVDDAGILVRDAPEAADAVRRLRADESLRAELAARAHDRA